MKKEEKSKEQLINELEQLHQRIPELEASEAKCKQTEETLRESEKRFQRMTANVPGLVYQWVLHPDGSFSFPFVSAASREMFGLEPEELMHDAKILFAKIHPDDVEIFQSSVKRSAETLQPWKEEIRHIINGQERWVACNSRPERQPNGDIFWDGVMLDITERKRMEEELREHHEHLEEIVKERTAELTTANERLQREITERVWVEKALRESEERFRKFFENGPEYCYMVSPGGVILDVNNAALKTLSYNKEELVGKPLKNIYAPESLRKMKQLFAKWKETGALKDEEMVIITKKGDRHTILLSADVVKDKNGKVLHSVSVQRDITERKRAEKALRESEERYRKLFDEARDGIFLADAETGVIVDCNLAAAELVGRDKSELVGKHQKILHPPRKIKEGFSVSFKKHRGESEGQILEEQVITRTGEIKEVAIKANLLHVGNRKLLQGMFRDITERKRAEKALRESEKKYRTLVESAQEGIGFTDPDENIIFVNEAFAELLAYKRAELLGLNLSRVSDKGEFVKFRKETKKRQRGESSRYETKLYTKAGEAKYFSISATPLFDGNGTFTGTLGLLTDITERKKAEEERVKLESQLRQAQKMEAIGTLASGVAHDFNNLLGGILGYASLLLSKLPTEDGNREYLERIERAGRRAAELTNRLLGFAHQGKCEVRSVDVNRLIRGVMELLSGSIDKRIEIKADLCKESPFTKGDPNQLEQVLMNLCVNARDAMPDGGELSIGSRLLHLDEKFVSQHLGASQGDYVCISVSDSGMGMDEETKAKIFDPFFTTKEQGEGTGLGLSMVYGIVKNHDGYISVYSEVGEGTTFEIYLPLSEGFLTQPKQGIEKPTSGSESILIVDDEEILRDLMKDILRDLGYEVMLASNGKEAIEVYRERQGEIDLVIVDMVMPRMGGKETYEELKRIDPGIRALLASGYSQNAAVQRILDLGVKGFLHKPFSVKEISRKVREVLDA